MNIVKRGFNRNGCAVFVLYTVAGSSVSRSQGIHAGLGLFSLITGDEGGILSALSLSLIILESNYICTYIVEK